MKVLVLMATLLLCTQGLLAKDAAPTPPPVPDVAESIKQFDTNFDKGLDFQKVEFCQFFFAVMYPQLQAVCTGVDTPECKHDLVLGAHVAGRCDELLGQLNNR